MPGAPIEITTLSDGGQTAGDIVQRAIAFVDGAQKTLELALYDIRLPDPEGSSLRAALEGAAERGVAVRLLYNTDFARPIPVPPPPSTKPTLIESLKLPTRDIPGVPDLMHHKYVVRDGTDVWTGSTNWTHDAWSRQENVILVVSGAPEVAAAYRTNFDELWEGRNVATSGRIEPRPLHAGETEVRTWFTPGQGTELSHRIAKAIGSARRRVRIASPVITAGPVLATLAERVDDDLDLAGVIDATQMHQVFGQWRGNPRSRWKLGPLATTLASGDFTGKQSTPYAPGSLHDYMHAKITVADDVAFAGSFNLSRSGEMNAENVLEIHDAEVAERLAAFIDEVRVRYPPAPIPEP